MVSERVLLLPVLCLQLLGASAVRADASPAEREIARSAMQAGDQLRDAGDTAGALQRYRSAHAIMHVPTTGLAVAKMQEALGLWLEACTTAMEVVNLPGEGEESAVFARAREAASQLAARLRPLIPSIRVEVAPEIMRYTVAIDGVEVSEAARHLPLKANPGVHRVEVRAPGYVTQIREVKLEHADPEPTRMYFALDVAESQAPRVVSQTPSAPAQPVVHADSPSRQVASAAPHRADAAVDLSPQDTRAIVGFAAGGVILLGGAAAGIVSVMKTSRLRDRCDEGYCGEARRDELSTANTLANVANVAIPLGVLGIAFGIYEVLSGPSADAAEHTGTVQLRWTGPQTIGVSW